MSSATTAELTDIAAQWRRARRLYPIYAALVRQFELGAACRELAYPLDRSEPEVLAAVWKWFDEMDAKIQVYQLRQVLQTSQHVKEEDLRAFLERYMGRTPKTANDRDKIDFLLVQYLAHQAPVDFHQRPVTLEEVAQVLEPVLGEPGASEPEWLAAVNAALDEMEDCLTLGQFLDSGVLARVRKIKDEAGDMFYGSMSLLTFTRFNFSVRSNFVHLIQEDIRAIRHLLTMLEGKGITRIDASAAGLSASESLENLKQICNDWKKHFRAEYAAGAPLRQIAALRAVAEAALANPVAFIPETAAEPGPKESRPVAPPAVAPPTPLSPVVAPAPVVVPEPVAAQKPRPAVPPATEAKPAAKPDTKPAPAAKKEAVAIYGVEACLDAIAEQLFSPKLKENLAVAHVTVGTSRLLLASWEVAAFTRGGDEIADALQRAVAARAGLVQLVETRKRGEPVAQSKAVIAAAHAEAGVLQEEIARAKDAHNIDAAVNLAATAKRLLALLEEAEKLGA